MMDSMYQLFLDELNFIKKQSYDVHQSMKNPDDCGQLVELAIRRFLKEIIGERFKITHGYIYSSLNKKLSPQIDIIITDKLVPHTLKCFPHLDNLEIVPAEAVVALFEVKRTLTKKCFREAIIHLKKIFDDVPLTKDRTNRYLPGGIEFGTGLSGGCYSNPMIGIIGLEYKSPNLWEEPPSFVDFVFSFEGLLLAPYNPEKERSLKISAYCSGQENIVRYLLTKNEELSQVKLLQMFTACIWEYLSQVSGRKLDMNSYFF